MERGRGATGKEIQDTTVSKEFKNVKFHIILFHHSLSEIQLFSEIVFINSGNNSR